MKKLLLATVITCSVATAIAQVGIGTTTPNASSILELSSTDKAFIPPRLTTAQRNQIANPVAGMVIFNSTTDCLEFYHSGGWYNVCTGTTSSNVDSSSNGIASANLIAHWPFDSDNKEVISNLAATTSAGVTVNASSGRIGGYASFNNGYLLYPTIPNTNIPEALAGGFTFSVWAKFPTTTDATNLLTSLWQINGNIGDIFGTAAFAYRHSPGNTLDFDGTLTHVNGSGTHSTAFSAFLEGNGFIADPFNWTLVTMVYDTVGGHTLKYYADGQLQGTKTLSIVPPGEQFELICTTSFGGTGRNNVTFGSFNYSPVPFAAGGGAAASWQNASLPSGTAVDDARLFNKPLSQAEITQLYNRGLAGR